MIQHPGGEIFHVLYPPKDWYFIQSWGDGHAWVHRKGLRVLVDCAEKDDGKLWLHVSVSRKAWIPSHIDMVFVKETFIGQEHYAYSVFPPQEQYVNIHGYCLHLWALAEGDGRVLPEFSAMIGNVKSI